MTRSNLAASLVAAIVLGLLQPAPLAGQDAPGLAGRWALNRELSQFPSEIGFSAEWASSGGLSGVGARAFPALRESAEDAKRLQQLTAEVRNPSARLTIVETPTAVTITDDRGQSRTFHPDGRDDVLQLDGVPVIVTAKREAGRLVVLYKVEQERELRYTYSRTASPPQLAVEVQFVERGDGDRVRRVYEPASAAETPAPFVPPTRPPGLTPPGAPDRGGAPVPASGDRATAPAFNQQPDAELKGLTKLGLVVEELAPQAAACGLSQSALETATAKQLTGAGFTVLRNADEDTYVYVNIMTTSPSTGLCVSRYDVFLYSYTTAQLSHQQAPVLAQVSLWHKGGLTGGAPSAHADGVGRGVQEYVDQLSTRIREANK